jgi:tetratricopeptide (TPR) repeat protein
MNDIVWGYFELGEIIRLQGDLSTAREMYDRSWHYFQDLKIFSPRPFYYRGIGDIAFAEGDYNQAKQHFQKSSQMAKEEYHAWMVIYAQVCLARAQIRLNELAESARVLTGALRGTLLDSNVGLKMLAIVVYAELYSAKNQHQKAAELASLAIETPATWQEYRDIASDILLIAARNIPGESLTRAQMQGKNTDWEYVIGELLSRSTS